MKYLFYDLENATQRGGKAKICEFGYVLTDEAFNVIERSNMIINPNIRGDEWDFMVVKKILTRPKKVYEKSPKFPEYIDQIKSLFEKADLVFGHTLAGDAKSLNDELLRYELPSIDYSFYDVKDIYKLISGADEVMSVSRMLVALDIAGEDNTHDAEADAYNTMLELKEIVKKYNLSMEELLVKCSCFKDKSEKHIVNSIHNRQLKKEEEIKEALAGTGTNEMKNNSANRTLFYAFLKSCKPNGKGRGLLRNKSVCISMNYECHHYRQMLNLVQLIRNEGGRYVAKSTIANYFVKYDEIMPDGSINHCNRLDHVNEAISNGENIKIISFEEFLKVFGLDEKKLDNLPMVNLDCIPN